MPKKQIYDRVGTTTTRVVDHLALLVKAAKFDKKNPNVNYSTDKTSFTYGKNSNGDTLITVDSKKKGRIIRVDYFPDVKDAQIKKLWEDLGKQFGLVSSNKKGSFQEVFVGTPAEVAERNQKEVRFEKLSNEPGGTVIPTEIQEKGTTVIFNRVLIDNVKFKKESDIMNDKKTREQLQSVFGPKWAHRLDNWTWTYFQQQKQFLTKYSDPKWAPFEYNKQDLVHFFSTEIQQVARDLDPFVPAGKYTTWNPADIFAAYDMPAIKRKIESEIKRKEPITQTLVELNNILVGLMEANKLVGLSLKKVQQGNSAEIHLHNVESSSILKMEKLEKYTMANVKLEYENLWASDSVNNMIKFGSNADYKVNISRTSGGTLTFNTFIKRTPAAQGGQAPIAMVIELIKAKNFTNNTNDYPQDIGALEDQVEEYSKMYDYITKGKRAESYDDFEFRIEKLYKKDKRVAIAKLMQVKFWYDALKYNENKKDKAELWTDILYLGMKVSAKGKFAPHAKIS
tara:strand:- start:1613 stop:3142 length:1530 start_codon:yes stop_codon:yes gene_type:complete